MGQLDATILFQVVERSFITYSIFLQLPYLYVHSVADPNPYPYNFPDPFPSVLGSGYVGYSNEHNKINLKGKFNKVGMPSGWFLVDLLTKKIKLRCIKSTV
jgi:hypothetical protein